MKLVAPSILSVDPANLPEAIALAESSGADYIHIDIMDGVFVPRKTWDVSLVKQIKGTHTLFNDVHIMVEKPWIVGPEFAKAGADNVTFHLEACQNEEEVRKTISLIEEAGAKASVSIKPNTPIEAVYPYLDSVYLVLIMSVEPGRGGQQFIDGALEKIKTLRKKIGDSKSPLIEVDGGINATFGPLCYQAGADILVSGSYLYGHPDFAKRLKGLKE